MAIVFPIHRADQREQFFTSVQLLGMQVPDQAVSQAQVFLLDIAVRLIEDPGFFASEGIIR